MMTKMIVLYSIILLTEQMIGVLEVFVRARKRPRTPTNIQKRLDVGKIDV